MKTKTLLFLVVIAAISSCKPKGGEEDTTPAPANRNVVTEDATNITANTTWKVGEKHLLKGFVYVQSPATLTIEAGSIVLGDKASKGSLIIKPGAKLIAEGTPAKPIVFTSAQAKGSRASGDWGGVILLGNAPVNKNPATIEGENTSTFGGANATDNSGTLKYVRIEFAGIAFQTDKEINGLTLGAVGSGTTLDYIQVSYSGDDSFEWFGGTVNAKHLIAYRGLDDDFDTDWGYSGIVQYGYILRDPAVADQCDCSDSNGFESDNDGSGSNATPQTSAKFANVSMFIAPGAVDGKYRVAYRLRRNTAISVYNSITAGGYPKGGIELEDAATPANFTSGKMELSGLVITGLGAGAKAIKATIKNKPDDEKAAQAQIESRLNDASRKNQFGVDVNTLGLNAKYNTLGTPNATLNADSPLLKAGVALPSGFEANTIVGAFGSTDWTSGWANFDPQNTDY